MAKILIIDDDGIVRDSLAVFLTREGHEVISAGDGHNGVLLFRNNLPDLVILDRDLPGMTGSAVFGRIREISKAIPVVILTGYDAPEDAEAYLADGAACFLSKGDGLSNVLTEIGRILGTPAHPGCVVPGRRGNSDAAAVRNAGALILVADDDEAMRGVLYRYLTAAGYKVILAGDGLAAEKMAREHKPDMVLLDIYMPGKGGVEVLRTLVAEMPSAGVIMITGNEDEGVARDCLRLGAVDYVSKPINLDALGERIMARLLLQK